MARQNSLISRVPVSSPGGCGLDIRLLQNFLSRDISPLTSGTSAKSSLRICKESCVSTGVKSQEIHRGVTDCYDIV